MIVWVRPTQNTILLYIQIAAYCAQCNHIHYCSHMHVMYCEHVCYKAGALEPVRLVRLKPDHFFAR